MRVNVQLFRCYFFALSKQCRCDNGACTVCLRSFKYHTSNVIQNMKCTRKQKQLYFWKVNYKNIFRQMTIKMLIRRQNIYIGRIDEGKISSSRRRSHCALTGRLRVDRSMSRSRREATGLPVRSPIEALHLYTQVYRYILIHTYRWTSARDKSQRKSRRGCIVVAQRKNTAEMDERRAGRVSELFRYRRCLARAVMHSVHSV